jgi:hypothetical protein
MKALKIGAAVCTAMALAAATNAAEPKGPTALIVDVRLVGEERSFAAASQGMRNEGDSDGWIFQTAKSDDDSWADHVGDWGDHGGDWGDHAGDWHHDDGRDDDRGSPSLVPEAATWQMLALGAALLGLTRIRARRRRASSFAHHAGVAGRVGTNAGSMTGQSEVTLRF